MIDNLSPYQQIEASLRRRVKDGDWAEGECLPGRRKLAEEYGVALSTVQRAIAKLLEDGSLTADGNRGTFVALRNRPSATHAARNESPSSLQLGMSSRRVGLNAGLRIGVVLEDSNIDMHNTSASENAFYGPLFDGIRSVLARDNTSVNYLYRRGRSYEELYAISECDGLIAIAPEVNDIGELKLLAASDVPFVALLTSSDADADEVGLPCVDADNRQGTAEAIRYLIDLGHKDIAIVNLATNHVNLYDRFIAFIDTMAEARLSIDARHMLIDSHPWGERVFQARIDAWIAKLVDCNNLPTAIYACDFTMTLKAMAALQSRGIKIPDDVSLIGFDYYPLVEHFSPPLTLVRQPIFQMGQRAATRLIEHLNDSRHRLFGTERLATELMVRRSCSAPRAMSIAH